VTTPASTGIIVFAAALVAVQLRPRGGPQDADVHEPAREAIPVPALVLQLLFHFECLRDAFSVTAWHADDVTVRSRF
jgi:hypothetical protein